MSDTPVTCNASFELHISTRVPDVPPWVRVANFLFVLIGQCALAAAALIAYDYLASIHPYLGGVALGLGMASFAPVTKYLERVRFRTWNITTAIVKAEDLDTLLCGIMEEQVVSKVVYAHEKGTGVDLSNFKKITRVTRDDQE